MRSLAVGIFGPILLAVLLPACLSTQAPPNAAAEPLIAARRLLRDGEFHNSAAAFQKIIDAQPSPEAYAGLVQSLLKLDEVKAADERSRQAVSGFADAPAAHAARGDVLFRRGLIPDAGEEYKIALKLDVNCARALLGQGKIEEARSLRRQARNDVARAHALDPEDGDALYEWAIRQPYPDNVAGLEKHLAEFHSDPDFEKHEREYVELLKALAGRRVWILDPDVEQAEIKMEPLMLGPGLERRGFAVRVTFNNRASAMLLLDTGASGVTITRKFAEKIGTRKLSDQMLQGIGKGGSPGYQAWVDKVVVGDLQFHDCFVHVVPQLAVDVDGLVGTDIFEKFMVALDFPARKLHLGLLHATVDSESAPLESFSPAYSFGHILLVPAKASEKASGLFVLDSGSNVSTISNELGLGLSQMRPLNVHSSGVGGGANSAFIADGVKLQFAGTRRNDQRLITIDLHTVSKNLGTELSGQIGFATLENSKLTIDYRDGLVKIEERRH
jgi:tetratricopeptide (TPR) repeat protein